MKIVLLVYLLLGVILSFVGGFAKLIEEEIRITKSDNSKLFQVRKFLFNLTLRLIVVFFYPIYYYFYFFDKKKLPYTYKPSTTQIDDGKLYFRKTPGIGDINCTECNYTENIISFTHGYMPYPNQKRCSTSGYQCEECGKFNSIFSIEHEKIEMKNCDCGGKLYRDKPLFCPSCKSQNLDYKIRFLT